MSQRSMQHFRELAKKKVACESEHGEAHVAHISINEECPWCGMSADEDVAIPVRVLWEAQGI